MLMNHLNSVTVDRSVRTVKGPQSTVYSLHIKQSTRYTVFGPKNEVEQNNLWESASRLLSLLRLPFLLSQST